MKIRVPVKLWEPPNFAIAGPNGELSIPLRELTDAELMTLADEWLTKLYAKAGKNRPPQIFTTSDNIPIERGNPAID